MSTLSPTTHLSHKVATVGFAIALALPVALAAASPAVAAAPTATTACSDYVYIYARGSGEPLGDINSPGEATSQRLYRSIQARITAAGSTITARQVGPTYSAPSVETLGANLGSNPLLWLSNLGANVATYLGSEKQGVVELASILDGQIAACPRQRFILAGYSQGAMVVNDYLYSLTRSSPTPARVAKVASAVLIANPERVSPSRTIAYGTAGPSNGICAVANNLAAATGITRCWQYRPGDVSPLFAARTLSVCNRNDIICATSEWQTLLFTQGAAAFNIGTAVHLDYPQSPSVSAAGRRAARIALS